jgi:hypothetical protein
VAGFLVAINYTANRLRWSRFFQPVEAYGLKMKGDSARASIYCGGERREQKRTWKGAI